MAWKSHVVEALRTGETLDAVLNERAERYRQRRKIKTFLSQWKTYALKTRRQGRNLALRAAVFRKNFIAMRYVRKWRVWLGGRHEEKQMSLIAFLSLKRRHEVNCFYALLSSAQLSKRLKELHARERVFVSRRFFKAWKEAQGAQVDHRKKLEGAVQYWMGSSQRHAFFQWRSTVQTTKRDRRQAALGALRKWRQFAMSAVGELFSYPLFFFFNIFFFFFRPLFACSSLYLLHSIFLPF